MVVANGRPQGANGHPQGERPYYTRDAVYSRDVPLVGVR